MASRKGRNKRRRERRKAIKDKEEAIKSAGKVWTFHFGLTVARLGLARHSVYKSTAWDKFFRYRSILEQL